MKPKKTGKSVTCLIALLIVLSGLMVLNWDVRAEERLEGTIEGTVSAHDGSIIPDGFTVQLKELSRDEVITSYTQGGYFLFTNMDVGFYEISVPSQTRARKAYQSASTDIFEVAHEETVYRDIEVTVKNLDYTLNGTVVDTYGEPVGDASITLSDGDLYRSTAYVELVEIENVTHAYYEIRAYEGTFDIIIEAKGYAPNITYDQEVTSDMTMNVTLVEQPLVSGYIWTIVDGEERAVRTPSEVTLINRDNNKILRNSMPEGSPFFYIGATPGDYTLVVSARDYMPYITDITVGTTNLRLARRFVEPAEDETIVTEISFSGWNTINIHRERNLHANSRMMGMDHWYLGNLAMQIDMALGNGDMVLSEAELDAFKEWLEYREANIPSTQNIIKVDGISYTLGTYSSDFSELNQLLGDVTETTAINMTVTSTMSYTTDEEIYLEDGILMDLSVSKDVVQGNLVDYSYELSLPQGFKRISSNKEFIPSGVAVSGHTEISIDPGIGVGMAHLTFDVRSVEEGEVFVTIEEGVHSYLDNVTYIVKQGVNITCIAEFVNPYDEPGENYSWSLNGVNLQMYGSEIVYVFEDEGEFELGVTVLDTGGLTATNYTTVIVDGSGPTGQIEVDNTTVDERQSVSFSAYNFTDVSDIRDYQWNFSDGTEHIMGMNVTHSFDLYGTYEVSVNVTDRLGNWNIETIEITVLDVTDPVPRFAVKYDDERHESDNITVLRLQRGQEFTLNASLSYDPAGFDEVQGEVTVWWWITGLDIGTDDMIMEDISFPEVGTFRISLNATDESGNYHNISRNVEITPGPAANLEVTEITLSTEDLVPNKKVKVITNVTNYGTANATNVMVTFRVNGVIRSITPRFYHSMDNESMEHVIPMGEYRLIKFDWTPESDGDIRLTVNVTDGTEPGFWQYDNELEIRVTVSPPAWRRYIGYIIVPIVIIGVTVGLYFYKDRIKDLLNRKSNK